MEVSIVCCYNNAEKYEHLLLKSLKEQLDADYELIAIDNSSQRFKCAAEALNYGVSMSSSENIIIAHQDVTFQGKYSLKDFIEVLDTIDHNTIIGPAGAVYDRGTIFERVICRNRICVSGFSPEKKAVKTFTEVDSLDECLFAFKRKLWERIKFDPSTCSYWDLYCVDFCVNNRIQEGKVYVIPFDGWHHSGGIITDKFYYSLEKMICKYPSIRIVSTCVSVKTKFPKIVCKWLILINKLRTIKALRIGR